jgi:energy-coupling factor transport system ATP-binding protein
MHTNTPLIETRDLWYGYEGGPSILREVSIRIEPGEFVAIIGQNGSGKTTLVKHFNGLLRPHRGEVLLDGKNIARQSVGALARQVGYVFQNPDHQIFSPTVREEVAFGPANLGLDEAEVEARTADALDRFGLAPYAESQPAALGFGLRRKVTIAAVYAMQTPVLILDEPTTGLDWKHITSLMALVGELNAKGHTIILITHDMRIVAEYAPRCMVIRSGRILIHGDTRDVFRQAALLESTHLQPPQIAELGRRMVLHGLREDTLTVPEFCDAYDNLIRRKPPEYDPDRQIAGFCGHFTSPPVSVITALDIPLSTGGEGERPTAGWAGGEVKPDKGSNVNMNQKGSAEPCPTCAPVDESRYGNGVAVGARYISPLPHQNTSDHPIFARRTGPKRLCPSPLTSTCHARVGSTAPIPASS